MHPQVKEYVMGTLRKRKPMHFGTRQKGGETQTHQKATVRGTDMTLVARSASKALDVIEMFF